jgi:hypothetical protein
LKLKEFGAEVSEPDARQQAGMSTLIGTDLFLFITIADSR